MDIREILKSLSPDHKALYTSMRNDMRRVYLNAHNNTVSLVKWAEEDDAFLDLIDIKLVTLFDRAGTLDTTKGIDKTEAKETEKAINEKANTITAKYLDKRNGVTGEAMSVDWKSIPQNNNQK